MSSFEVISSHLAKRLVVAGMPQSGTTALYNIISFIQQLHQEMVSASLWYGLATLRAYEKQILPGDRADMTADQAYRFNIDTLEKRIKQGHHVLIKEHHCDEFLSSWADLIFVGKRDIRDSIASRRRRGKNFNPKNRWEDLDSPLEDIERWCNYLINDCFLDWKKKSYVFCYEEYKKDPQKVIDEIHVILRGTPCQGEDMHIILDGVNNLHRYDPKKTFFSENKITAGGKVNNFSNDLTSEETAFIEGNYPEWIVNYEDH
tara:strand:+ start:417 stop:1196 length:780 start_codon:yes stop_codon:yes gene_type:complete